MSKHIDRNSREEIQKDLDTLGEMYEANGSEIADIAEDWTEKLKDHMEALYPKGKEYVCRGVCTIAEGERYQGLYINFFKKDREKGKKTDVWNIFTSGGTKIGELKWFPAFRKIAFFPCEGTVYDSNCLNEIAGFSQYLMGEYKKDKERVKSDEPE